MHKYINNLRDNPMTRTIKQNATSGERQPLQGIVFLFLNPNTQEVKAKSFKSFP